MKCKEKHPKDNECVICFAFSNNEVCIDTNKRHRVCGEHRELIRGESTIRWKRAIAGGLAAVATGAMLLVAGGLT